MKEEVDNPSDENYLIILAESDKKEEKEGILEKDFHILKFDKKESELIEDLQEEFDWRSSRGIWLKIFKRNLIMMRFSKESKRFRSTYILWN